MISGQWKLAFGVFHNSLQLHHTAWTGHFCALRFGPVGQEVHIGQGYGNINTKVVADVNKINFIFLQQPLIVLISDIFICIAAVV